MVSRSGAWLKRSCHGAGVCKRVCRQQRRECEVFIRGGKVDTRTCEGMSAGREARHVRMQARHARARCLTCRREGSARVREGSSCARENRSIHNPLTGNAGMTSLHALVRGRTVGMRGRTTGMRRRTAGVRKSNRARAGSHDVPARSRYSRARSSISALTRRRPGSYVGSACNSEITPAEAHAQCHAPGLLRCQHVDERVRT
jgi:hypothetical protein